MYVFVIEMAEYKGKEQKEQQQQPEAMDIFGHELIPLQEDEDINNFITELFDENNTLPKCELDQWLEDYLEEMEIQQQQQQQEKKKSQEKSLLDMCQYSDISSVEEEEKKKIYQVSVKKIRMKTMMVHKIIMKIICTIVVIVYFAIEVQFMESKEEILVQNL